MPLFLPFTTTAPSVIHMGMHKLQGVTELFIEAATTKYTMVSTFLQGSDMSEVVSVRVCMCVCACMDVCWNPSMAIVSLLVIIRRKITRETQINYFIMQ